MGQRRGFAADDAMQVNVHETLYRFYATKKISHVMATVKNAIRCQQ